MPSSDEELDVPEPKVVLVGQANVGKTCIVQRAVNGIFNDETANTLGASYTTLLISDGDTPISRLQIWDTAGQEKFRGMAPMYYRGCDVAILIYSIDDMSSFEEIESWYHSLKENIDKTSIDLYLVGNKKDLVEERQVSYEDGERCAVQLNARFYELSAKTGEGIEDFFRTIARLFTDKVNGGKQVQHKDEDKKNTVSLKSEDKTNSHPKKKFTCSF
ncbi:Ras-related protein Rab-5B [Histomonas meleagridis]|uniref:Ras-related protein Rab-5B n=1 Tax=Histomonas meleagridis TaxID=135588 RepID=UPI003559FCF3|nr:Ras-related protein Rab-5B [Histomonas meleagridis]KAH0798120.1 Ras-related protein Rab-5B [Histomonas meleagridis]